jgi:hypothetical protein
MQKIYILTFFFSWSFFFFFYPSLFQPAMLLHPISLLSNWPLPMPSKPTTNLYLFHLLLLNGRLQLAYDIPNKLNFCPCRLEFFCWSNVIPNSSPMYPRWWAQKPTMKFQELFQGLLHPFYQFYVVWFKILVFCHNTVSRSSKHILEWFEACDIQWMKCMWSMCK